SAGIVTHDTILRWHGRLVAKKYDGARRLGRPIQSRTSRHSSRGILANYSAGVHPKRRSRQFGPAVTEPAGNRTMRTPPRSHHLERTRLHAPPTPPHLLFSRRKPRDRTLPRTCETHHRKQARDCRDNSQRRGE